MGDGDDPGVSGGTTKTAKPSPPESDLLSRESGLALIEDAKRWQRAYDERCEVVGRLEEALRAMQAYVENERRGAEEWGSLEQVNAAEELLIVIEAALAGGTPPDGSHG